MVVEIVWGTVVGGGVFGKGKGGKCCQVALGSVIYCFDVCENCRVGGELKVILGTGVIRCRIARLVLLKASRVNLPRWLDGCLYSVALFRTRSMWLGLFRFRNVLVD